MKKLTILNLVLIILGLGLTAQENPEQKTKVPSDAGRSTEWTQLVDYAGVS